MNELEVISQLKSLLTINNVDGYIIPSNDEYMSEYTPIYARRLEYITNFTGSNGLAIILLQGKSLFFTDGRYLDQASKQIDQNIFTIIDLKNLHKLAWDEYLGAASIIGYDPKIFTEKALKPFPKLPTQPIETNLVDQIWDNKSLKYPCEIYHYPLEYSGEAYASKIAKIYKFIDENEAECLVVTASDSLCWLFNIRSNDIEFSPILLSYAIITKAKITIFTERSRVQIPVIKDLKNVEYLAEEHFSRVLKNISGKIILDSGSVSKFIENILVGKNYVKQIDPCQLWKACKNPVEINQAKAKHIIDATAVCEFLSSIELNKTEYELGLRVSAKRAQNKDYMMDSFPVICGFRENSAIIHYQAKQGTAKTIEGDGILLVDSGGQYFGSTTDVTRTVIIGNATLEQKTRYTQVLKGHIALSTAIFPKGTNGSNLDVLARQYLWQDHQDYPHGTGHGVGNFLNVHEGPQGISLSASTSLHEGMIISNEPGFYKSNEYGIRIENLIHVVASDDSGNYLKFQDLTLIPHCRTLIMEDILSKRELQYLKDYYQQIQNLVRPLLSLPAKKWLDHELAMFL